MKQETNYTRLEARATLETLKQFIPHGELTAMREQIRGEEGQYFINKMVEVNETITNMPETYEQDGKGDQAIAYLHYFSGNMDWYITEKDMEGEQLQAYGIANIGYGFEGGYVSIVDLVKSGVELDLYFTPKTLAEIRNN